MKAAFFDHCKTIFDAYTIEGLYKFLINGKFVIDDGKYLERDGLKNKGLMDGSISYNQATDIVCEILSDVFQQRSRKEVSEWCRLYAEKNTDLIAGFVPGLFDYLINNQYEIYIVSASVKEIISAIFHEYTKNIEIKATEFEIVNGKYTGKIVNIINNTEKKRIVESETIKNDYEYTIGFGDSEGDLPMLEAVNKGFLINPRTPKLQTEDLGKNIIKLSNPGAKEIIRLLEY